MRYFLDTNILIDLLGDRKPFSKHAIQLLTWAMEGKAELYTSSHSIATCYYILKKHSNDQALRIALETLMETVKVISVSEDILKKSLRSGFADVEDAIQVNCADTISGISGIVTRNVQEFKKSTIPVLAPDGVNI
jgi:predicted nucleic acid-binding protein